MPSAALSGISGLLHGFSNTFVAAKLKKDAQERAQKLHDQTLKDADDRAATVKFTGHLLDSAKDGTLDALPAGAEKLIAGAYGKEVSQGLVGTIQSMIDANKPRRALQAQFTGPQAATAEDVGAQISPEQMQQPGAMAKLDTAGPSAASTQAAITANPQAAKLAFEGKIGESGNPLDAVRLAETMRHNRATEAKTGSTAKPTIRYDKIPQGDNIVTKKTVIQPDGTIQEEIVGTGKAARRQRPVGEKEIEAFTSGNSIVQQLDEIEAQIEANPKLGQLLNSSGTFWRQLTSEQVNSPYLKQQLGTMGLSKEEADFLSTVARVVNQDIHDFAGKAVTGYEGGRVLQQTIGLGQAPDVFLGRLKQTRRNVLRILGNRAAALKDREGVPEIVTSRDKEAAALAARGNRHAKAYLDTSPAPAPAVAGGGSPDDDALNAAFLGQ